MNRVYVFGMFAWDSDLLHRTHKLATHLARTGVEVCHVEKVNGWNPLRWGQYTFEEGEVSRLRIQAMPYLKGWSKTVFRLNDRFISRALRRHLGKDPAIALIGTPHWARAVGRIAAFENRIHYDISDDYLDFAEHPRWREILEEYEAQAIRLSRKVFLTIDTLQDKVAGKGIVIENGVDLDQFAEAKPVALPGRGRKIGFIGGLYRWIDFALIGEVARAFPEDTLVLIGPTDAPATLEMIGQIDNVEVMGVIPKERIHHYYASLDVGILPFVSTETYPRLNTVNSNKVFQYLYFGYPVVSTAFPQVERLADRVWVAHDHDAFIEGVRQGLQVTHRRTPPDLTPLSWENRARTLREHLEEA